VTAPPLLGAARVRALLDRHGVAPKKSLGQNFVIDPNTIRKLVAAAGVGPDDDVLEVGPGVGSLTVGLAAAARRVVAVEVDVRLMPLLREVLAEAPNVELVNGDALTMDIDATGCRKLVANLPYNLAATLVIGVLIDHPGVAELTVMTQREVAERIVAQPGSKVYGTTSVLAGHYAEAAVVAPVSRRAFYPVPNVDSALIHLRRKAARADCSPETFIKVVKTCFGQRRKTMRNALAPVAGSPGAAAELLERAGVDPSARPEQLPVAEFVAIARHLDVMG
jgi:16S rRNA (adenine1518-N6/adenine1519-N6)-dimethyltransferase